MLLNITSICDFFVSGTDRSDYTFTTTPDFIASLDAASANRDEGFFCGSEAGNAEGWITGHSGLPQIIDENGAFKSPAIGLVTDILTSTCPFKQCAWDNPGARFLNQEIQGAFPVAMAPSVLKTIRSILDNRYMAYKYCCENDMRNFLQMI